MTVIKITWHEDDASLACSLTTYSSQSARVLLISMYSVKLSKSLLIQIHT